MNTHLYQTNLDDLLGSLPSWLRAEIEVFSIRPVKVTGIVQDNRLLKPGNIFVARVGRTSDGHRFIYDAIQRGASAIIGEKSLSGLPVPYIKTTDGRLALAYIAAAYYRFPARKLVLIGITGTDGKTTTCHLIFNILKAAGYRAGMITTVSAVIGEDEIDTGFHVTTPEAIDVQRYLSEMVEQKFTHVVLEVTSHGLHQHRVSGCDFDLAVITNITHEHLDYHGSYEKYREAKSRLFRLMVDSPHKKIGLQSSAVINRDDSSYEYLSSLVTSYSKGQRKDIRQISYGLNPLADVWAEKIVLEPDGMKFGVQSRDTYLNIKTEMLGAYNASNILAAVAATSKGLKIESRAIEEGVASTRGIPGRMELVEMGQLFTVLVDFAHTPNALKRSLESVRQMLEWQNGAGKIIAIFGSAGLRDRAKRQMMAEISVQLAEITILTAEDPRTESLQAILDEMKLGAEAGGGVESRTFWRIPDRRQAIRFGINMAKSGDIVIALGKGHEQSMCYGMDEYSWDDRLAMKAALAELLNIKGPEMPYLPDWT